MLINGFWSTWSQLVDSLDPFGERNALKALELEKGASQEEIRSRYRELTKQFHPDKVQGNQQEKDAAHEKFVQIQQVKFLHFYNALGMKNQQTLVGYQCYKVENTLVKFLIYI